MKGEVLHYDDNSGIGQISGADGIRYNFTRSDLKQLVPIKKGSKVDFDFEGKDAHDIYLDGPVTSSPQQYAAGATQAVYEGPVEPEQGMWGYFTGALTRKYATFSGRARRKEYWSYALFLVVVSLVLGIVVAAGAGSSQIGPNGQIISGSPLLWIGIVLVTIFSLATIIPSIAIMVRRLHDIGWSGWAVLIGIIPYVGGLVLLIVSFIDSQRFQNKFGPPPKTW